MLTLVNFASGLFVILSQIFLVWAIIYVVLHRKDEQNTVIDWLSHKGDIIAAVIVVGGIIVSLFYSRVAGFAPCLLCVIQRYFLYPQIIFIAISMYTKKVWGYVVAYALSLGGALVALYHNYLDYGGADLFACDALGGGISCTKRYVFEFGYVTIPMMSLTAFLLILFFLTLKTRKMCDNKVITDQQIHG